MLRVWIEEGVRKGRQKGLRVSDFALLLAFSSEIMTVRGLISLMVSLDVNHLERKKKRVVPFLFFFVFLFFAASNAPNLSAYI